MKNLLEFLSFDAKKFFKDKQLVALSSKDWSDYKTKEKLGTKIEVVVFEDNTKYQKEGTNRFEKFYIKTKKDIQIDSSSVVKLVNPVCSVYGEFRNCLSVICDDVIIEERG